MEEKLESSGPDPGFMERVGVQINKFTVISAMIVGGQTAAAANS